MKTDNTFDENAKHRPQDDAAAPRPATGSTAAGGTGAGKMTTRTGESYFDGGALALLGINLLTLLVSVITLFIATPWMVCRKQRYIASHTVIGGRRLRFDGTGLGLLGNSIKWALLTLITLSIYGLWLYVKQRKWVISHTSFEDGDDYSEFDGGMLGWLGTNILVSLVSAVTLGIAAPWMTCYFIRWDARHTVVSGNRLDFAGKGLSLLGHGLLWLLLTVITVGIYGIWLEKKVLQWKCASLRTEAD